MQTRGKPKKRDRRKRGVDANQASTQPSRELRGKRAFFLMSPTHFAPRTINFNGIINMELTPTSATTHFTKVRAKIDTEFHLVFSGKEDGMFIIPRQEPGLNRDGALPPGAVFPGRSGRNWFQNPVVEQESENGGPVKGAPIRKQRKGGQQKRAKARRTLSRPWR